MNPTCCPFFVADTQLCVKSSRDHSCLYVGVRGSTAVWTWGTGQTSQRTPATVRDRKLCSTIGAEKGQHSSPLSVLESRHFHRLVNCNECPFDVAYRRVSSLTLEGAQDLEAERTRGSHTLTGARIHRMMSDKPLPMRFPCL